MKKTVCVFLAAILLAANIAIPILVNAFEEDEACSCNAGYGWYPEPNYHWYACKKCLDKVSGGPHSSSWNVNVNTHSISCTTCGYNVNGSHEYGSWISINNNQHRRYCYYCNYQQTGNHYWVLEYYMGGYYNVCLICRAVSI